MALGAFEPEAAAPRLALGAQGARRLGHRHRLQPRRAPAGQRQPGQDGQAVEPEDGPGGAHPHRRAGAALQPRLLRGRQATGDRRRGAAGPGDRRSPPGETIKTIAHPDAVGEVSLNPDGTAAGRGRPLRHRRRVRAGEGGEEVRVPGAHRPLFGRRQDAAHLEQRRLLRAPRRQDGQGAPDRVHHARSPPGHHDAHREPHRHLDVGRHRREGVERGGQVAGRAQGPGGGDGPAPEPGDRAWP